MKPIGPQNLQAKFLVGLGAIVLLLGVFLASSLYFHLSSLLDTQVREKADLVFSQVSSVQGYVRETLRPKMYNTIPEDEFVIEAMSSSFISRAIMDRLNLTHAEYHYRRVAQNARNPEFEIAGSEMVLLEHFQDNPHDEAWEGYREIDGKKYFVKARPVTFTQSCLACHGQPSDSPPVLLDRYGSERGFGHTLGETAGLVVVGVPVEGEFDSIRGATMGYAALYGGGMLLFFGLVQFFFNKLIMTNLRILTSRFRALFEEDAELGALQKFEHADEIEEVVQGLEELGDHIVAMNSQLRLHSENMEQMVAVRTGELRVEVAERRADVQLFVQLLDGLNQSATRRQMWEYSLPLVVERFRARSGGFVCMLASQTYYTWPEGGAKPELPDNWKTVVTEAIPHYESGRAFIPVGSSDSSSEGILCLEWEAGVRISERDRNVLRALGQQLGIAMLNLAALGNLLRQKDMLQAIVESIRDPLLLMDGSGGVVLANEAARALAATLGGDHSDDCSKLFQTQGVFENCPLQPALLWGEAMSQEVQTEDGRLFAVNVFPVAEGAAQEGRGVVYVRDVTQEKNMLAAMQQSEKLATVGQLAAGLAHEINNPLGVIRCYAELLKGSVADEALSNDAQIILKHASQAQNILQDLLNFARPKNLEPVDLDVGELIGNAVNVFRVQADKKGVEVRKALSENLPSLFANEQSIEQILANLLKNSLDAVDDERGVITVSAVHDAVSDVVVFCVADNGPGIEDDHVKRLFDPFFSTKQVGKGTGLGLAVVYGIVQEMGGEVEVTNDGGAVFKVTLPVAGVKGGRP